MKPISRIIVSVKEPADGVTPAIAKAAQLARGTNAQLELFHAITTPVYLDQSDQAECSLTEIKRGIEQRRLQQLEYAARALRLQDSPGLSVDICARWDWPHYAAIIRRAEEVGADLVVATRHSGAHIGHSILHYADWELLQQCPVPVLLVAGAELYRRPVLLAAVDPSPSWARPSQLDERILELGEVLSTQLKGTLHAVHAFDVGPLAASSTEMMDPYWNEKEAIRRRLAAQKEFDALMCQTHIGRGCQHLLGGPPADGIAKVVDEVCANIVIMGVVSRSVIQRLFLDSTAERALERLPCDLLVVKPLLFKTQVPNACAGARVIPALPITMTM